METMTNAEITMIWYLGDALAGNTKNYWFVFYEVRQHYFKRQRSKEFKDIINCAQKFFEQHKPKNRRALKKLIPKLLSSEDKTEGKVGYMLKVSIEELEAMIEMRKAPYYDPIKGKYIDREDK